MSQRDGTTKRRDKDGTRLRMDSYTAASSARPSRAARAVTPPKRNQLDKVMKKARSRDGATQSNYWNKKLLEAEEKDPNRWRHSGYKELYGANGSPIGSRASKQRSRSRSRVNRGRARSRSRSRDRRPHTPQPTTSRVRHRLTKAAVSSKPGPSRRSPKVVSISPSSRSLSSCSDESCSVCSPKPKSGGGGGGGGARKKKVAAVSPPNVPARRSRSRSFSVPRNRPSNPSPQAVRAPARGARPRQRSGPPRDPRGPPPSPPPARAKLPPSRPQPRPEQPPRHKSSAGVVKKRRPKVKRAPPVVVVPEAATARRPRAESCSDDSTSSSVESTGAPPKLTLSERFGKMAQWSVDRRDLDGVKNMRITKDSDSSDLKVVIEDARYRANSPMPANDRRVGAGYYPEALHTAPVGLDAWDDVRVRYKYYKDRGYLRDLTLDDYMKWEEWWYKYQEWLEAERYYERWDALRAEEADKMYYHRMKRGARRGAREFQ